ncbi:MAG: 5-deoxy-glucuronate isomerase [Clostridiales bacterium]|nr:5-deoxy-glucuronate isomerase [Clostridiales bacterium]
MSIMPEYLIRAKDDPEPGCRLEHLDFRVRGLSMWETEAGETGDNETGVTILYGICDITVDGKERRALGRRDRIEPGCSPHVCLIPPGCAYSVKALTEARITVSATKAGGGLRETVHVPAGSIEGVRRGTGKTERVIYDLIPEGVDTKLMIYEVFTPEGNWSSFPPHKHDEDTEDERLLEEVYLFHFDPPEGFALVWLTDGEGGLDEAYAVKDGDLELIPRGYHTMAVSPGYLCSTHAVMAGPTNEWKIKFMEEYKHLYDWDK